jgi:hypothetical protein
MKEQEFFSKFDMHVEQSRRKLRRIPNMWQHSNAWNHTISDQAMYTTMPIEEVDCVDILMPADRLQDILAYITDCEDSVSRQHIERRMIDEYYRDRSVRLNNPAVEKAYQRYVTLLELARK